MSKAFNQIKAHTVYHLPIIKAYADKIQLVEIINQLIPSNKKVDHDTMILAMVIDTLTGRNPLYRLEEFYSNQDTELLLGKKIHPSELTDDSIGRTLDATYDYGSMKVFSAIALNASKVFAVMPQYIHFDTTSKSVFGDYRIDVSEKNAPNITHGHSKDKRPDLKQFIMGILCTDGAVPIFGMIENGNASDKKINNEYYKIDAIVEKELKYGPGRPGPNREPKEINYFVKMAINENEENIAKKREEAGCFVLFSNLPKKNDKEEMGHTPEEILRSYKEQHGVERNFTFLKDPVIVNSIFLKKQERIEVLGLVFLLSLLIWSLMERSMRQYVEEKETTLTGFDKKQTDRPTSFMMTTKFFDVIVLNIEGNRRLGQPLGTVQKDYLKALGLNSNIFIKPKPG